MIVTAMSNLVARGYVDANVYVVASSYVAVIIYVVANIPPPGARGPPGPAAKETTIIFFPTSIVIN
jgi:hypothetical protein